MTESITLITDKADHLLLIGHGSRDPEASNEYYKFAHVLGEQLQLPVQPCFLEFADPPIVEGLTACVNAGAKHIIALPLFLGAAGHQKNDVPTIINWGRAQWPDINIRYGTPLGAHYSLVSAIADRVIAAEASAQTKISPNNTAILVVGRGSRDPDSNSDVYKIARMLWEGRDYGWVEVAFFSLTDPGIEAGIERCIRLGAKRVIVVPYLLFTGIIHQRTGEKVAALQPAHPDIDLLVTDHLSLHPAVVEAVKQRITETIDGTANMTCDACKYRQQMTGFEDEFGLPQSSDHHHGLRGVPHTHGHDHSHSHHHHHNE